MKGLLGWLWLGVQLLVGGYLAFMVLGMFIAARATPKRPGQTTDEYARTKSTKSGLVDRRWGR